MANKNTKQAHKLGFSSMRDANNGGHKTAKGACIDSGARGKRKQYPKITAEQRAKAGY